MKTLLTIILAAYSIFFILLYVGVFRFEISEDHFLVIAGMLSLLFCFSLLALIFIARSMLQRNQSDIEPQEAEEETLEFEEELEEDQPEQFSNEQVLEPNIDLRIQEHRHPTIARIAANRGGPANKKYMNTPTR